MKKGMHLVLFFVLFALPLQAQQTVDPRLVDLESSYRTRVENHLKTVFKDDIKFAVGLQIVPLSPEELKAAAAKSNTAKVLVAPTATPEPESKNEDENIVEGGYLPYPTVIESKRARAEASRQQTSAPIVTPVAPAHEEAKLEFKYVNIGVYLYENKIDDKMIKFVREQTQNALIGVRTRIQVLSIAVPKVEKEVEPPKPFDLKNFMMENMQSLALIAAALCLGLFLLVAFAIVAKLISGSLGDLASSIKQQRGGENKPAVKDAELVESSSSGNATPFVDVYEESFKKSLASIRQLIQARPDLVRDAISADAAYYAYFKAVLPYLEYGEQKFLLESLGRTHLLAIAETEDRDIPFEELRVWINHLVERVAVRSLTSDSASMRLIEASDREILLRADHRQIIDFIVQKPTAGAMLLGMEVLSEDEREEVLTKLDVQDWRTVLTLPAEKIAHEVKSVTQDMVKAAQVSTASDGFSIRDLHQFWEKNLLVPTVRRLNSLPIGEEDEVLRELSSQSEQFYDMVLGKFWPVSALEEVPRDALAREWKEYSPQDRLFVILGLPEHLGSILLELIPEGTARTVLLDNLKRAREKQDDETLDKAREGVRAFMDVLREKLGSKFKPGAREAAEPNDSDLKIAS